MGVAGFNLSVAQHFKNSRQNSSSVKSLGLKEKSLQLRSKVLDQMINTSTGYSPLPLTEQYVALQQLKIINKIQILSDQYDLLSNGSNSTEVEFEKIGTL